MKKIRFKLQILLAVFSVIFLLSVTANSTPTYAQNVNPPPQNTPAPTATPVPPGAKDYVCGYNNGSFQVKDIPIIGGLLDIFNSCNNKTPNDSTQNGNGNPGDIGTLPPISTDILQLIQSYGLPTPLADGSNGYSTLRSKVIGNANAMWAAQELLNAEKKLSIKSRYLSTAWLWSEGNISYGPDPYLVNCHDNTDSTLRQSVAQFCPGERRGNDKSNLLQIAGYQLQDKALFDQIVPAYQKVVAIYGYSDIKSVLQGVYDNSDKASIANWSYKSQTNNGLVQTFLPNGQVPSDISIDSIATSKTELFTNQKIQFYTSLLGKNPGMVIALKSLELEGDGFISLLKSGNCLYTKVNGQVIIDTDPACTYYNKNWKQTLSNMIAALYLIDTGESSIASGGNPQVAPPINPGTISGNCTTAGSVIVVPGARQQHLNLTGDCIKPTMIVIHWSGSWGPTQVTFDTLNLRGLGCQLETDENELVQTMDMFSTRVERSACVANYNNTTISNELSGSFFDDVYPNPGNKNYQKLLATTNRAIQATCWQMKQYNISADQIYGHLELNPEDKIDPGENYINYYRDRLRKECR